MAYSNEIAHDILDTVIDNGRVTDAGDVFDASSLKVEVEFEAQERGLQEEDVQKVVQYAEEHTETND